MTIGIGPVLKQNVTDGGVVQCIRAKCKCILCSGGVRRMGGEMVRFILSSTNKPRLTHCLGADHQSGDNLNLLESVPVF